MPGRDSGGEQGTKTKQTRAITYIAYHIQFPDEYLGIFTRTFVSGRLSTSYVSSLHAALVNDTFITSLQDS